MFTNSTEKQEVHRNINEIGQQAYKREACSISLRIKEMQIKNKEI